MTSHKRTWAEITHGTSGDLSWDPNLMPHWNNEWQYPDPGLDQWQLNQIQAEFDPSITAPAPFVETETSQPVYCYGSIIHVNCQLLPRRSRNDAKSWDVVKSGDFYGLSIGSSGDMVAMINKQTCQQITKASHIPTVYFTAHLLPETDKGSKGGKDGKGKRDERKSEADLLVDLNVFGSYDKADEVGKLLSDEGLSLQRPLEGADGTKYYNPHYFHLRHSAEADAAMAATELDTEPTEESNEADQEQLTSIMGDLSHGNILREHQVDSRIKSPLLPHQKFAVDFMLQREKVEHCAELSLWRYNDDDEERTFWQHKITEETNSAPEEERGGILADDMGLGKSLTTISLIASTGDQASSFERSGATNSSEFGSATSGLQPCAATLIVVPSSLLINSWMEQVNEHAFAASLSCFKYHGEGRKEAISNIRRSQIVLTTYATLAADNNSKNSVINTLYWYRLVLDEAHEVRNISTKRHQAVNAVTAQNRWCLTGTPIQNTLDDLAALVAFLKVPILEEQHKFRKFITPHSGMSAASRYQSLRTLLRTICLRRTREVLNIPEPDSRTREVLLTENERAKYNAVIERSKELVDMSVSKRGTRTLNAAVLESLLRLRLFCNNGPAGITYSDTDEMPTDPDEMLSYLQQCDKADCVYCKQMIYSLDKGGNTEGALRIPTCDHLVCYQCMGHFRQDGKRCPSENCASKEKDTTGARKEKTSSAKGLGARKKQKLDSAISTHAYPYAPGEAPSKLKACLDDIESEMSPFSKPKCIVFSSWTKTLYLVGHLLFRRDIPFEMIHGSLSVTTRIENLKKFQSQMGPNVLLMTLGTGAVGLNLAVATRVFLLEPQWNPAIEAQAFGRALRLGQTEQVQIIRYIVKETVEDSNVMSRHQKKMNLVGGGFGGQQEIVDALKNYLDTASAQARGHPPVGG